MATEKDIHVQIFGAWNARDFEAFRDLLHPDYSYTGGDGKEITGGPDVGVTIAKMYASAFPDSTIVVARSYSSGNVAVAEFVARGTHGGELMGIPATGRAVEIRGCNIAELRDGKVYREREYIDMMDMLAQLGVEPPVKAARAQ